MSGSDHFDGKRFFNPRVDTDRGLRDLWRWRMAREPGAPWPAVEDPPAAPPRSAADANSIVSTYIGQAAFLIQSAGFNVLTDPIFSENAGPASWLGPRRARPPAIAFDALPPIHLVLVSHNHYDHMDLPTLKRLHARWKPAIVTGLNNGAYLAGKGIRGAIELDWWESCDVCAGMKVTFVPAQHWSKRGLFDLRTTLWGGHVVKTAAGCVYFAGDTGYPAHFAEIRQRLGAPDVALLPIGAYEPRWFMGPQHMNPDDAVRAHLDLNAGTSIAMHFATFRMTDEGMDDPVRELGHARIRHGVPSERFIAPEFGRPVVWTPAPR